MTASESEKRTREEREILSKEDEETIIINSIRRTVFSKKAF